MSDIALRYGTPCYTYSRSAIEEAWQSLNTALSERTHLICYAVKANANLAVLNLLARLGSGFDVVSIGELERVLQAQGDPHKTIFSGVGKRTEELERALAVGIKCFNVESLAELQRLNRVAGALGKVAPVALRVNPNVDAATHPYIATGLRENKFGIPAEEVLAGFQRAKSMAHLDVVGIACHIGSQITCITPFVDALAHLKRILEALQTNGITLRHIDIGGGLGIRYRDETPPSMTSYVEKITAELAALPHELVLEPGRSIVGNAGVLLTRVEYLKITSHKNFAVVDAAMNDLLRPALYGAWHEISRVCAADDSEVRDYDVVGPVCETSDIFGKNLRLSLQAGDLLAIGSAGAYGFTMASNYNTRPLPVEVMVDRGAVHEIRKRQTLADLTAGESILPL